jgi:drug/metabolite transporter (DMT)-like permease
MEYVGPYTFNGIRFALGSMVLVPMVLINGRNLRPPVYARATSRRPVSVFTGGILAGVALFAGASLQQVGLVYTTAGNAGFITGLYVVIVPLLGLLWRQRPGTGTWIGAVLAAAGLYLLSITEELTIARGDLLVLIGAFFWAGHVLILGWLSPRMDPVKLALAQFATCSLLSLLTAGIVETITMTGIRGAAIAIVYGGVMSVGIAYTLQVVAQRRSHPAHAAIILSMEAVFAAVGGWLFLNEIMTPRGLIGCTLMLGGMILSQLWPLIRPGEKTSSQKAFTVSPPDEDRDSDRFAERET